MKQSLRLLILIEKYVLYFLFGWKELATMNIATLKIVNLFVEVEKRKSNWWKSNNC